MRVAPRQPSLRGLLRAYAAILFVDAPWAGALFLLATFWFPNAGASGLLAALIGVFTARVLRFPHLDSGLHVYNSLLVGLALGAYYQLDIYLLLLITLGAIMAVFTTVALSDMLWRLDRLPALSLPFVLVALTATLAAHSYGTLSRYLLPMAPHDVLLHPWFDQFLTALATSFFIPHPLPGLLMFLGILFVSRYLALLAIGGFTVGFTVYVLLTGSPHPDLVGWNGFNFILTAVAIGGIFTVPSLQSFALAMVGSVLAALVTSATETFMLVYGLPAMALPFLLTTLILLMALKKRPPSSQLQLLLEAPALPEVSHERARMAEARQGEFGSVAVLPPFYGRWTVYQGFDGQHTHRPPWQHALDFHIVRDGRSFSGAGTELADYHCFSLPVLAPVAGYVAAVENTLPDNRIGEVNTVQNWGNHLLIHVHGDLYVLLAHLMQHSVEVSVGDYVYCGQMLAKCGNSGRSPQPHLHMHVQWGSALGGATAPFHLTTVLHRRKGEEKDIFRLHARPEKGDQLMLPAWDQALRLSLDLRIGRTFCYEVRGARNKPYLETLSVVLTLDGQFRLQSETGASAAFVDRPGLLAFYDRQGPEDPFLDAFVLALGLTPLANDVRHWRDRPSLRLFPLSPGQRIWAGISYPLGAGVYSEYSRERHKDTWIQQGEHRLPLMGRQISVSTRACIVRQGGCVEILLHNERGGLRARLQEFGQSPDVGIPAWQVQVNERAE